MQLLVLKLVGRVLCLAHGNEAARGSAGHGGGGGSGGGGGGGGGAGGGGGGGDGGGDLAGRSGPIAAVRLPAAKRWVEQHWGRGGWAWLTATLGSAPPTEPLLEALTQLLLGTISLATGPGVITSGAGPAHGAGGGSTDLPHAGVRRAWGSEAAPQRSKMSIAADELAHRFVHAPALLPLLQLCAAAPPALQHSVLLSMTLWLQHSADDANPLQLAQQFGWQLPLCSMLNMTAAQGAHGDQEAPRAQGSHKGS